MLIGYLLIIKEGLLKKKKYFLPQEKRINFEILKADLKDYYTKNNIHAKFYEFLVFSDMKILNERYDT